ncbi:MAG: tRNA pseudouridine(55) synthase TruB [Helicobacteraceae bacterium]|nr:tRNA pseudouridine(55) synthase TruB [Helicobacteraceae bacterium]
MNRLFVGFKPAGKSSNQYLSSLKRKYSPKKSGYSGTLDPFAKGVLVCAFGTHTKLFRFLNKTPKSYRATLWLGADSETLDIEKVTNVEEVEELKESDIQKALNSLVGTIEYLPPKYSAKKIDGKRAYALAREDKEFTMNSIESEVYETKLIHYNHPFITFEISVSEGAYIRSLAQVLLNRLNANLGTLSALERLNEGLFRYNGEKSLDIREYLNIPKNIFIGNVSKFEDGKVLNIEEFEVQKDGTYWVEYLNSIAIVEIEENSVKYVLNKVEIC